MWTICIALLSTKINKIYNIIAVSTLRLRHYYAIDPRRARTVRFCSEVTEARCSINYYGTHAPERELRAWI